MPDSAKPNKLPWRTLAFGSRLSARFTRVMVFTGGLVFLIVAVLVVTIFSSHTRSLARADARATLAEVQGSINLQARELDALILGFQEWTAVNSKGAPASEVYSSVDFDRWVAATPLTAGAWIDASGNVTSSTGDQDELDALMVLTKTYSTPVRGPALLPSGPSVVALRQLTDPDSGKRIGTMVIARAIEEGPAVHITASSSGELLDKGWRTVNAPEGYTSATTRLSNGILRTRGALPTLDMRTWLLIELSRPDPWLGEGRVWFVILVPVGLGLLVIGTAYVIAGFLGRSIDRPLHQFVSYLQDQGYLALQGLRTDEEVLIDRSLPEDFAKLGHIITDLMTQLRINQSELIEAGDQALAAEMAFRTVVEESPEVKILVRGGVVEIANPAAAHFFGLQLGDLLRAEPDGLFSGIQLFDEAGAPLQLLQMAREAKDGPVVARCVAPEQPDRWIELSVAFIDYEGDDYVISARNITEERRLEALRAEVLSLVSHDLRSPLTVVRGYLDILDKKLDDERRKTAVESARRAATRMEELLDDLLHATRAERVFAPRVMRPVDLSALVDGIASSLGMGSIQSVATTLEPGVTVLGDPVRLEQAIANLIGNAVKHGPAEGEIRVSVTTNDGRAIVRVEDDGEGIPADQREKVFERGARTASAEGTPGLGLGLYIVRVVAEAHGGNAFVDGDAEGTCFVVELPVVQSETDVA